MSDWEDDPTPTSFSKHSSHQNRSQNCENFAQNNNVNDGWGDDGNNRPAPMHKNGSFDGLSFEVSRQQVGMVIGRQGATIKSIEQKYNVSLKIGKFEQLIELWILANEMYSVPKTEI